MAPLKFTIKCGNFAVLVDLHILPLGAQGDASWFTTNHIEEVTALVRDAVDHRVKQYTECQRSRKQAKQKKELAPASTFIVKGKNFNLAANFLKRHITLRCIAKQIYGDLRVFPERYVVCVSSPGDATAHHGNLCLSTTELSEQSTSEYFSRVGEIQEPLNSPTKTKKTVLQKIAKKASVQREFCGSCEGEQQIEEKSCSENQRWEFETGQPEFNPQECVSGSESEDVPRLRSLSEAKDQIGKAQNKSESRAPDSVNPDEASAVFCPCEFSPGTRNCQRCKPRDAEDPAPQRAKRTCLGNPPAALQTPSTEHFTQTFKNDPLPLPPLPPDKTKSESKAFPVSECKKTTLEVELLTPGKRAQRLPLTSNNTAQTNQNRLATSLRGLSVKLASSGSSISSRSTTGKEGSEYVARTSRLRRLKRS